MAVAIHSCSAAGEKHARSDLCPAPRKTDEELVSALRWPGEAGHCRQTADMLSDRHAYGVRRDGVTSEAVQRASCAARAGLKALTSPCLRNQIAPEADARGVTFGAGAPRES